MKITSPKTVEQALANIRLSGVEPSDKIKKRVYGALRDGKPTTSEIIDIIKSDCSEEAELD